MTFPARGMVVAVTANMSNANMRDIALNIAQAFAERPTATRPAIATGHRPPRTTAPGAAQSVPGVRLGRASVKNADSLMAGSVLRAPLAAPLAAAVAFVSSPTPATAQYAATRRVEIDDVDAGLRRNGWAIPCRWSSTASSAPTWGEDGSHPSPRAWRAGESGNCWSITSVQRTYKAAAWRSTPGASSVLHGVRRRREQAESERRHHLVSSPVYMALPSWVRTSLHVADFCRVSQRRPGGRIPASDGTFARPPSIALRWSSGSATRAPRVR